MDSNTYQELAKQIIALQAENERLRQQMQLMQSTPIAPPAPNNLTANDSTTKALASSLEHKSFEILSLKQTIGDLKERATAALQREQEVERELSRSQSAAFELDEIRSKCIHLEARLNDMNERLQQLSLQQVQQQQQTHRIAELESLLAIAEEANELLRKQATI